jgi:hypothetical protein
MLMQKGDVDAVGRSDALGRKILSGRAHPIKLAGNETEEIVGEEAG